MIYKYPKEVHDFVKKWTTKYRDAELAERCNKKFGTSFTASSMKSFRSNHKYYSGQKSWTHEEYWKYQTRYPKGMIEFVRKKSWGVPSKEMAEMVNKKFGTNYTALWMKRFRQRNGIKCGITGWFQKGRSPGNKGKKLEEFMSPEAIEKSKATRFSAGHKPSNLLPVGSIVITQDGYKLIKKSMTGTQWERWELLHRSVWKEHNGEIPEGMLVSFKDSNTLNCDIDNLMLISKAESAVLTHSHLRFADPDMTEAAVSMIRLNNAIKDRKGRKKSEKG